MLKKLLVKLSRVCKEVTIRTSAHNQLICSVSDTFHTRSLLLLLTSDEYQNSDYTSNQISADIPKVSILHQSKRGATVHRQVLI